MAEFSQALVLTTPHEQSKRVRDAQYLMKGNSVFGAELSPLKDFTIDGDFGLITAQAAARSKFWIGYPTKLCTPTFGQALYDQLVGKVPLSKAEIALRKQRLAAQTIGQKGLEVARTQVGVKESPHGSNIQKYGSWYGFNGVPWCAIFESWCLDQSGYRKFHYAAVEAIYYDALAGRNSLRIVSTPQPGDVVCYSLHGSEFAHTAFFVEWVDQKGGAFTDLGGNTGPSSVSNGGEVLSQPRSLSMVKAFVRIG